MHWTDQFERLIKHQQKHDQGIPIRDQWRLGACTICFPIIGLGEEAGQFWEFYQQIIPEAKLITNKGQERVLELVHANKDIVGTPTSKDLGQLYNIAKALILCVQYEKAPLVGLETVSRGVRRVVIENKDFRTERNPITTFQQFLIDEEGRKSPIGIVRSKLSNIWNKNTAEPSIAEEYRDHISVHTLIPEDSPSTLSGENTPDRQEGTSGTKLIEGLDSPQSVQVKQGQELIKGAAKLDIDHLRKLLEEIEISKTEDKGKGKDLSPRSSPPSETTTPINSPPTRTTDLTL